MKLEEIRQEALARAVQGQSLANYPQIIEGFIAKGIPADEISPRENTFTYRAWQALGRQVRKGEHGVRVVTWIPIADKTDDAGKVIRPGGKACRTTTVFHISQTISQEEAEAEQEARQERCERRQRRRPPHIPAGEPLRTHQAATIAERGAA